MKIPAFCLSVFLGLLALPTHASPDFPSSSLGDTRLRLEILDPDGSPSMLKLEAGTPTAQLRPDRAYSLRLTNLTDERLLVILSVDNTNPATGRPALRGQDGIVLAPGASRVLAHGRANRKSPAGPLLPLNPRPGALALLVFDERQDFPTQMPGVKPAPYGKENYTLTATGTRRWIPPSDYPFRKRSVDPAESLYLQYGLSAPLPALP